MVYGARTLTVDEVVEGIAGRFFYEPQHLLRRRLLRVSSQLIMHDHETDQLRVTHLSVIEFVEQRHSFPKAFEANQRLLDICNEFLTPFFDKTAPREKRIWDLGHFISYAITLMPYHRKVAELWLVKAAVWNKFPVSHRGHGFNDVKSRRKWYDAFDATTFKPKYRQSEMTPLNTYLYFGVADIISDLERAPRGAWDFSDPAYQWCLRYLVVWTTLSEFVVDKQQIPNAVFDAISKTPWLMQRAISAGARKAFLAELFDSASLIHYKDHFSESPLVYAISRRKMAAVEFLCENGVDPNELDARGRNPLLECVRSNSSSETRIVKALLSHGADPNYVEPGTLRTPLFIAVAINRYNSLDFVQGFIDAKGDLDTTDSQGQTLLHAAINKTQPSYDIIKRLLDLGVDPSKPDHSGQNAFHLAIDHRSRRAYDILMAHSSIDVIRKSLNANSFQGASMLHHAMKALASCFNRCDSILADLLDQGLDINSRDETGQSPIHWVVSHLGRRPYAGRSVLEDVQFLIQRGADISLRDDKGRMAADLAATSTLKDLRAMLDFYSQPRRSVFGPYDFVPYWYERFCEQNATTEGLSKVTLEEQAREQTSGG